MKNELNFTQALEVVEKFMAESGIRQYCSEICKGRCCEGCYSTSLACHKNEGRRLSCSMFICSNLADQLNIFDKFSTLYSHALHTMTDIARELTGGRNVFFNPWSEAVKNEFRIDSEDMTFFTDQHNNDLIKFTFINRWTEIKSANPNFRPIMTFNNKTGRPEVVYESR